MDLSEYGPWGVVAGGSKGLGACFARGLAEGGLNVLLVARSQGPLDRLACELKHRFGVEARGLAVDLCQPSSAERIADATADLSVGMLVYNAGSPLSVGPFLDKDAHTLASTISLSTMTPALLTHCFGRRMREQGHGAIILVGSLAGVAGSAYLAEYAASKAFGQILAESLWYELQDSGVRVLSLIVGRTATPTAHRRRVSGTDDDPLMSPAEVAAEALVHLADGPTWIAGAANRRQLDGIWQTSRREATNILSTRTAKAFGDESRSR